MRYLLITPLLIFSLVSSVNADPISDRVVEKGEIRCGYGISPGSLDVDPNTGEFSGVSVDIMETVGQLLDLKVNWAVETGWGNIVADLESGRIDMFCSALWPDAPRMKNMTLSQPIFYNTLYPYVRADEERFVTVDDFNAADVTIPAIEGDISVTVAKQYFPKAKVLYLPQLATVSDMMMSLTTGKADAVLLLPVMAEQFNANNSPGLKRLPNAEPVTVKGANFAVKAGAYRLRDMINSALDIMIDDGQIERIITKHGVEYLPPARGYKK